MKTTYINDCQCKERLGQHLGSLAPEGAVTFTSTGHAAPVLHARAMELVAAPKHHHVVRPKLIMADHTDLRSRNNS